MAFLFDHERLDVYQLELKFIAWVTELLAEVKDAKDVTTREALDHLDRASLSALFNTAEGNGKRRRKVRARYFDHARGSATECASCLDALVAKSACTAERVLPGKKMLHRVVSMLSKLVFRYAPEELVSEPEAPYGASGPDAWDGDEEKIEHEDEDEDEHEHEHEDD